MRRSILFLTLLVNCCHVIAGVSESLAPSGVMYWTLSVGYTWTPYFPHRVRYWCLYHCTSKGCSSCGIKNWSIYYYCHSCGTDQWCRDCICITANSSKTEEV